MNRAWRYVAHPFLLPFTLLYALWCVTVYRAGYWKIQDGVVTCIAESFERAITPKGPYQDVTRIWFRPKAQTIGALTVFASEEARSDSGLRVHENTHIVQQTLFALGGLAVVPPIFIAFDVAPYLSLALSGFIGALAYGAAYVALFLGFYVVHVLRTWKPGDWHPPYEKNPLEVWAREEREDYNDMRPVDKARIWGHR